MPDKSECASTLLPPGGKSMVVGEFTGPRGALQPEFTFAIIDLTDPKSAPVFGTTELGAWGIVSPSFSRTVKWSPDGKLLATSTADGRVAVWDVARVLKP